MCFTVPSIGTVVVVTTGGNPVRNARILHRARRHALQAVKSIFVGEGLQAGAFDRESRTRSR